MVLLGLVYIARLATGHHQIHIEHDLTLSRSTLGYSLAFSETGGPFIGDLKHIVMRSVLEQPVPQANNKVPAIVYYMQVCIPVEASDY